MRLFTEHALAAGQPVELTANQAHYLRNLMRAGPGDAVLLFNGRDGEWSAEIAALAKKSGSLTPLRQERPQTPEPGPWLLFAPLKRGPLDFLVQKAVELGASALHPVLTAHTDSARINRDRLAANAVEAAEQCERLTVPPVRPAEKLIAVLENWPQDRHLLVCAERGAAPAIDDVLRSAAGRGGWAILIGPEGGFAQSELDLLGNLPFATPVCLGPHVLRAETAALAALSCWQAVLGDWRGATRP